MSSLLHAYKQYYRDSEYLELWCLTFCCDPESASRTFEFEFRPIETNVRKKNNAKPTPDNFIRCIVCASICHLKTEEWNTILQLYVYCMKLYAYIAIPCAVLSGRLCSWGDSNEDRCRRSPRFGTRLFTIRRRCWHLLNEWLNAESQSISKDVLLGRVLYNAVSLLIQYMVVLIVIIIIVVITNARREATSRIRFGNAAIAVCRPIRNNKVHSRDLKPNLRRVSDTLIRYLVEEIDRSAKTYKLMCVCIVAVSPIFSHH